MSNRKRNKVMPECKDCDGCDGCKKDALKTELIKLLLTPRMVLSLTFLVAAIGQLIESIKS